MTITIRVYEFGLLAPTKNADLVDEQISRAHRYRNVLVEIERQRRDAIRAAMGAHPDVAPLEEQIQALVAQRDQARQAIADKRKASRSRSESPHERKAVRDLNALIKPLRAQIKEAKQAIAEDPAIRAAIDAANQRAKERLHTERAACGVYWSTYLLQEAAADQARREITPPKFARWTGEGRVSVQLQGGLKLEELWGTDTQIRIIRPDPIAHDMGARRGARLRAARTELHMRVGSDGRQPIWAVWPMIYHRPLPEGAIIKVATVSKRRRDSTAWDWRVHMTVDVTNCVPRRPVPERGVVALNMGFCLTPSGAIRSGYMVGDDGLEEQILLLKSDAYRGRDLTPAQQAALAQWIPQGLAKAERIRSHRDKAQDLMRGLLCAWKAGDAIDPVTLRRDLLILQLGDHRVDQHGDAVTASLDTSGSALPETASETASVIVAEESGSALPETASLALTRPTTFPEWFIKATEAMHAWRSPERFRRLASQWKRIRHDEGGTPISHRFEGDETGLQILETWLARDTHLECYEGGLRRSALRDRREGYRILAARMAQRYRTLLIDDTDLRVFQRSPQAESERCDIPAVKYNQRLAAPSELRAVMINAFGTDRVVKYKERFLSRRCHCCGHVNEPWDLLEDATRMHTCDSCGVRWDIDSNFDRNLLAVHQRDQEQTTVANTPRKPYRAQRLAQARRKPAAA